MSEHPILREPPNGYGLGRNNYGVKPDTPLTINDVMARLFRLEQMEPIQGYWDIKDIKDPQPYVFLRTLATLIPKHGAITAAVMISTILTPHGVQCKWKEEQTEYGDEVQFYLIRAPHDARWKLPAGPTEKGNF